MIRYEKEFHYGGDKGLVGPQSLSERCGEEKYFTPAVIRTPTVQPIARLYTD
jgi:hypothetical protein